MDTNFVNCYISKDNEKVLIIDKENIQIEQKKNEKYDVIYLNGVLEIACELIKSKTPEIDLIKYFKNLLNDNGRLFLSVDNSQGVKYIVGNKSEYCNNIYDSLKKQYKNGRLFSKAELNEIVQNSGFKYSRYYYPLPNYNNPNVVFTDKKLPNSKNSKLNYNVIYNEESLIIQDEIALLKIFIEEGKFTEFTNSYIVELSNNEIDKSIKYYSLNNMRKDKYSLIIKLDDNYVKKYPQTSEALKHIKNINKNSNKLKKLGFNIAEEENDKIVVSKIINLKLMDEIIVENINDKESVYKLIDNWFSFINEKLLVNKDGITKYGFIDMVFENTFYDEDNNKFVFFDQEWYEDNIPIKYILYRAIKNLYSYNPEICQKIPIEEMFERYDLNKQKEEFENKEVLFQKEIIDEQKQSFYAKQYEYKISSEEIKQIIKDVKKLDKDNVELLAEVKKLDRDNVELIAEIKRLSEKG